MRIHRTTASVLGLALLAAANEIPQAAMTRLLEAYPAYRPGQMTQILGADFDGDGRKDWAGLASKQTGEWAILIAYDVEGGWREGNVDMGQKEHAPASLAPLPSGHYERHVSCTRALEPNERQSFESTLPGILAVSPDGWRSAYQLGRHTWGFVCLGRGP